MIRYTEHDGILYNAYPSGGVYRVNPLGQTTSYNYYLALFTKAVHDKVDRFI